MPQTLRALNAATFLHREQKRKSGEPYIYHPVRVTSELLALGIQDDITLAVSLMHDTIEDCKVDAQILHDCYDLCEDVTGRVRILSKNLFSSTSEQYTAIGNDWRCSLIKISDRCNNVSTMVGAFSKEKMAEYLIETEQYVIPLCKHTKDFFPEYSNQVFVMKYHIETVCKLVHSFLSAQ